MKDTNNIEYWDLIAKYYADECNQDEIDELFKWLEEDKENYILFNEVKNDLEIININKSMNKINVDSAWDKLKSRISEDEEIPVFSENRISKFRFTSVLKYAAAVIVVVGLGFFATKWYRQVASNTLKMEYAALNEQGKELILPDGSKVILNSDSEIRYPKTFTSEERRVLLEGEAYFDVVKQIDSPFIIEVNNAEVKVLGTSFNVNASIPGDLVEVYVETGLVQLSRKMNGMERILINPGDVGVLTRDKIVKEKNSNENIIAWKTGEIVFHENHLKDVITTLNKVYKANITCENQEVLNLRYTSTFRNQNIDSILNVICLTFNLKVVYENDKIYLIKNNA